MSAIPMSFFQTSELPVSKKYEAFRESIGVVFEVDKPDRPKDQFDAWIKSHLIDELMLVECQTVGQKFVRSAQMIARDGLDHLLVQIFYEGFTVNTRNAEERICGPGRILVLDASRPWEAINSDFRNLTIVIPRRLIAQDLMDADCQHGRMIDSLKNPYAAILIKYIFSLDESVEHIRAEDACSLVRPSLDLVAATLNYRHHMRQDEMLDAKNSFQLGLRFRIKHFLDQNLTNSDLGIPHVLQEFKISKDQLRRMFPDLQAYLLQRRLEFTHRRLLVPRVSDESVEDVALSLGFKDLFTFCQAFKKFFSLSPYAVKNRSVCSLAMHETLKTREGLEWMQWFKTL